MFEIYRLTDLYNFHSILLPNQLIDVNNQW